MDTTHYFDLTLPENDLEQLTIKKVDHFDCDLINTSGTQQFKGFVLARSPGGNNLTICDIEIKKSAKDQKYQPRLVFRRVDDQFTDVSAPSNARNRRIPFADGVDGYREFWRMISFLYKFKEMIDFGEFDGTYQIITSEQFKSYMSDTSKREEIAKAAEELGVDISEIFRTQATITLLKNYRSKLQDFISNNASETDVQNWLDEGNGTYRQQRCLIFGIEFIDFKREGSVNSKRFDVLTRVNSKYVDHVLIELKSPADDIFEIESTVTGNNPSNTYKLHKHLSRAIPQILEYKHALESKSPGDPELEKIGIFNTPHINKCIIVIGKHSDNPRWRQNRKNLLNSLNSNLEIWTYTELLNKLNATISNLERIKSEENLGSTSQGDEW